MASSAACECDAEQTINHALLQCPSSSWTAWPDGSRRWENQMTAQNLPLDLVRPSSGLKGLAQTTKIYLTDFQETASAGAPESGGMTGACPCCLFKRGARGWMCFFIAVKQFHALSRSTWNKRIVSALLPRKFRMVFYSSCCYLWPTLLLSRNKSIMDKVFVFV